MSLLKNESDNERPPLFEKHFELSLCYSVIITGKIGYQHKTGHQ